MPGPRPRILAAIILAMTAASIYIVLALHAGPLSETLSGAHESSGEVYTHKVEVEGLTFIAEVRPAPAGLVEAALNDTTWSVLEWDDWKDRIREGWRVLEVKVELVNTRGAPIVLAVGGPYCMSPFGDQEWPLDQFPELVDREGEAIQPPGMCQLALREITILPQGTYESVYYVIVEPGYEGVMILQPEICEGGECGKVRVEIPLRDPEGGGG